MMIGILAAVIPLASEPTPRGINIPGRRFCTTSSAFWYVEAPISDSVITFAAPRATRGAAPVSGCAVVPPPPPQPHTTNTAAHNKALCMSTPRAGVALFASELSRFECPGCRREHVGRTPWPNLRSAIPYKRHQHVCSVQGPVGRHVVDGLVLATKIPARRRADDEVPRSWCATPGGVVRISGCVGRASSMLVTEVFRMEYGLVRKYEMTGTSVLYHFTATWGE